MALVFNGFDSVYKQEFDSLWRFCFLMTADLKASKDLTFRTFLVLGSHENADSESAASIGHPILWSTAVELIQHYFTQKMRHKATMKRLKEQNLPFPVNDALLAFLRFSINKRFAAILRYVGFSVQESHQMLRRSAHSITADLSKADTETLEAIWSTVIPPEHEKDNTNDQIWQRFSERSVGFENSVHQARRIFDRIAPWLALAVLALFAFAYWYSGLNR